MDESSATFFTSLGTLKYFYIFMSGLTTVMVAAWDRYNVPTFNKSKLVPFVQLPPARYLTIDSRYRHGLIIYLVLMGGLYTALCWIGPSIILGDPRISAAIDPKYKDLGLWPIGVAALLTASTLANDNRWIGKIEYFARQYAQKVAYIPAAVTDLAYSLRNVPIKFDARGDELGRLREAFLRDVLGSDTYNQSVATPPVEGAFANWIRANICYHCLAMLFADRVALGNDRSDVINREENKEIRDRIKTHYDALRAKCPPDDPKKANDNFEDIQVLLRETSLLLASILSQMSRNPRELRDAIQALEFGEEIALDDRSNWGVYVGLVVSFIIAGSIISAVLLYLLAKRLMHIGPDAAAAEIFTSALSACILFIAAFVIGENLRDKWLSSGDWEESLGRHVKHLSSTALWSMLVATILTSFINSLMGRGQGVTVLIPVGINNLVGAGLVATFFLIYMYRSACDEPPRSLLLNLVNTYALGHGLMAAGLLIIVSILSLDFAARSGTSQTIAAAQQNFQPIARIMKGENATATGWFATASQAATVDKMSRTLDEMAATWSTPSPAWPKADSMKEPEVVDARLKELIEICGGLNSTLKSDKKLFDEKSCKVKADRITESNNLREAAKKTGDDTALAANRPYMATATALDAAYDALVLYKKLAGFSKKLQVIVFTGLTTLIVAYLFGVGCRSLRTWLLIEHKNNHGAGFTKLKDELAKSRRTADPYSEREFEKFLRTPIDDLGRMAPIEAMRYEDYRAKLFTLIDKKKVVLTQS